MRPATVKIRSRRRLGSHRRALPGRASIWVQVSSSQAMVTQFGPDLVLATRLSGYCLATHRPLPWPMNQVAEPMPPLWIAMLTSLNAAENIPAHGAEPDDGGTHL
jgi:hypothetical protein